MTTRYSILPIFRCGFFILIIGLFRMIRLDKRIGGGKQSNRSSEVTHDEIARFSDVVVFNDTNKTLTKVEENNEMDIEVEEKTETRTRTRTYCGCPGCDWAAKVYTSSRDTSCEERIHFLITNYNQTEETACRNATQTDSSPSCGEVCNPDVCKVYSTDEEVTNRSVTLPVTYNLEQYARQEKESLRPLYNKTIENRTCVYQHPLYSGFCNELMMFFGLVIEGKKDENGCSQIVVESIKWKDQFNTKQRIRHDLLWDVVQWNQHYPTLPRFVSMNITGDESYFPDVYLEEMQHGSEGPIHSRIHWKGEKTNATKPKIFQKLKKVQDANNAFKGYERKVKRYEIERNDADIAMMRGALRPHPAIVHIMNNFTTSLNLNDNKDLTSIMVLHARVEPDMMENKICLSTRVTNITHIIEGIYKKFREPPVTDVLLQFDRNVLENWVPVNGPANNTIMAKYNLKVINEMRASGMWNGRVKVQEAGSLLAIQSKHPIYSKYFAIVGGIINFYLALEANIFIGSAVSTYSASITKFRFYRDLKQNYFYRPEGLGWVTSPDMKEPPGFKC